MLVRGKLLMNIFHRNFHFNIKQNLKKYLYLCIYSLIEAVSVFSEECEDPTCFRRTSALSS